MLWSECFIDCEMLWCIVLSLCARCRRRRLRRLCDSRVCHVKYTQVRPRRRRQFYFSFFLFRFLSPVRGVDDQIDQKPYRLSRISWCAQCTELYALASTIRRTTMPMHDKCTERSSDIDEKIKKNKKMCIFCAYIKQIKHCHVWGRMVVLAAVLPTRIHFICARLFATICS